MTSRLAYQRAQAGAHVGGPGIPGQSPTSTGSQPIRDTPHRPALGRNAPLCPALDSGVRLSARVSRGVAVLDVMRIARPLISAEALTVVMAVFFLIGGLFQLIASFAVALPGWRWQAADGSLCSS